jgi:hypothetical protein
MKILLRVKMLALAAAVCFGSGPGCGKDEAQIDEKTRAGKSGDSAEYGPADSADKAVLTALDGLKQNRLDALWDFLPASYQKDLNDLVHAFAGRMDAELWSRTAAVLRKLAGVLKTKGEFLRPPAPGGNPAGAPQPSGTDWAEIAEVLTTILDSDLGDIEKLKTADAGKVLAGTGGKLLAQLQAYSKLMPNDAFTENLDRLSRTQVKLVSSSGDKAKLTLTATGEEPKDVDFVRVEGKWVPQSMADSWDEMVRGEAFAWLSTLNPEFFAEKKPPYLAFLSAIETALDGLSAADTRDEFQATLKQSMETVWPLMAAMSGAQPAAGEDETPEPEAPAATEMVTVVVETGLDDNAQNELREKLGAVTDDRERAATELTGDEDTTIFRVGPVSDIEAFAKKIDFLKVTNVDAKTRTITAERK